MKTDPRVDTYIRKAADWQQPILNLIREVVHDTCPDVEETMKWSSPSFMYKGMMCGMQAFKSWCLFGFWKAPLVLDDVAKGTKTYRYFGKLTKVSDLPSKRVLAAYIRKAMALNENGVTMARRPRAAKARLLRLPSDLTVALKKNKKAQEAFDAFSPSHKNEYVEWIVGAKAEDTRKGRLDTAIEIGRAHV